jgi:uncharacterized membrane protein required for colicin V production
MNAAHALLPVVDWIAIGLLLAGVLLGLRSGLGRAFAFLLWLLAALWLGTHLSAQIVSWLPNTTVPDDPHAQRIAYGVVAGVVLLVPVFGRLLGGAAGKKKQDKAPPTHKPFGALVGLFNAILLLVLLLPFLLGLDAIAQGTERASSPRWAAAFARQMAYLYPAVHRDALEAAAAGKLPAAPAASTAPDAADTGK